LVVSPIFRLSSPTRGRKKDHRIANHLSYRLFCKCPDYPLIALTRLKV
jgi:hypothetical protein